MRMGVIRNARAEPAVSEAEWPLTATGWLWGEIHLRRYIIAGATVAAAAQPVRIRVPIKIETLEVYEKIIPAMNVATNPERIILLGPILSLKIPAKRLLIQNTMLLTVIKSPAVK
jgi:hypothetical protein